MLNVDVNVGYLFAKIYGSMRTKLHVGYDL